MHVMHTESLQNGLMSFKAGQFCKADAYESSHVILLPAGWPLDTGNDIVSRGLAKGHWDLALQVPVLYIYQTHTGTTWMVLGHAQSLDYKLDLLPL